MSWYTDWWLNTNREFIIKRWFQTPTGKNYLIFWPWAAGSITNISNYVSYAHGGIRFFKWLVCWIPKDCNTEISVNNKKVKYMLSEWINQKIFTKYDNSMYTNLNTHGFSFFISLFCCIITVELANHKTFFLKKKTL